MYSELDRCSFCRNRATERFETSNLFVCRYCYLDLKNDTEFKNKILNKTQ